MKDKQRKLMCGISLLLIGLSVVVIYAVHREIPFMMDDLWYSTMLYSDTPITSLGDIVEAQIWHYNNWGGRSITHGLLQLILLAGEQAADIMNVLATLLLSGMICVVAKQKKLPVFLMALGMLLGLNANWKMSMFWQAGAANYLYITIFLLAYLACYLRELPKAGSVEQAASDVSRQTEPARLPGITLWILPLGLIAGWSNENMGPVVWVISLLVILLRVWEHRSVRPWMILGNLASLVGSVLVIIAPGNSVRSAQVPENAYGLLWRCFLRGYAESTAALDYLFPVLLLTVAVLFVSKGILKLPIGRENLLLLLGALLSWGAMILSPHYPDRATFGTMVLLICVILSAAGSIYREKQETGWMLWGAGILIWLRGMYFLGEYLAICWGWIR